MSVRLDLQDKLRKVRSERYILQSVAKKALPDERVSNCLRLVQGQVEVWKHLKTEKSFYNGLMVCGSVWNCPLCAAKISERRKKELETAFNQHKALGGRIALLTLTFSHKRSDILKDTIKRFSKASSRFRSGARYNRIRDKMQLIGSIRVFEITFGDNGFHPHSHIALFYENQVDLEQIQNEMRSLWALACFKNGLTIKDEYGLKLQDGDEAEKYLSKHGSWSLEQELSKSHIKVAKKDSLTPFDFLRQYVESDDPYYLQLFKEYAEAMKGKRQVQWSQGLKKRFIIEEKTDELLAQESVEQADLLGMIPFVVWKYILKTEKRAQFLDYTEQMDFETALDCFERLYDLDKISWKKEKTTSPDEKS